MSQVRRILITTLFSLGLLLILLASAQGNFVRAAGLTPTPTIDRLAKPTLPANPDIADKGAQDYWLYCSPCHGDKAQGLTDEFRKQYPVEDQFCWNSGCHGKRPYPNGWTIPRYVPALVGPLALKRFPNAAILKGFIQLKMPFQSPGILKDAEYWRLTAFLLKQNGYWDGKGVLNESTAAKIIISADSTFSLTPTPALTPTVDPQITPEKQVVSANKENMTRWFAFGGIFVLLLIAAVVVWIGKKW